MLIVPIFIPFGGCAHQCVFCNQAGITGAPPLPQIDGIRVTVKEYLRTWNGDGRKEVAFYGGSFTGLPVELQKSYLEAVQSFLKDGSIDGLRVSTRPDYITVETLKVLKQYSVDTVELGVQSMSAKVLKLSGRGHSVEDVVSAVKLLREGNFIVGLQMMPGLPGDTFNSVVDTAGGIAELKPDFVRVYPTLVIEDTPLKKVLDRGDYKPWTLDDMVDVCKEVSAIFKQKNIQVIRMGLQPTKDLDASFVAGPYHHSFRQLVEKNSEESSPTLY